MKRKLTALFLAPMATLAIIGTNIAISASPVVAQPTQNRGEVRQASINLTALIIAALIIGGFYFIVTAILKAKRKVELDRQRSQSNHGYHQQYPSRNVAGYESGGYGYNNRSGRFTDREVIDNSSDSLYGSSGSTGDFEVRDVAYNNPQYGNSYGNTGDVEVNDVKDNGTEYGDLYQSGNDSEVTDSSTGGSLYGNETEDAQSDNDSLYGSESSSDTEVSDSSDSSSSDYEVS